MIVDISTGDAPPEPESNKNPAAVALGKLGSSLYRAKGNTNVTTCPPTPGPSRYRPTLPFTSFLTTPIILSGRRRLVDPSL